MEQSIINVTMDKDLRRDFDNICQELGVTMVFGVEE